MKILIFAFVLLLHSLFLSAQTLTSYSVKGTVKTAKNHLYAVLLINESKEIKVVKIQGREFCINGFTHREQFLMTNIYATLILTNNKDISSTEISDHRNLHKVNLILEDNVEVNLLDPIEESIVISKHNGLFQKFVKINRQLYVNLPTGSSLKEMDLRRRLTREDALKKLSLVGENVTSPVAIDQLRLISSFVEIPFSEIERVFKQMPGEFRTNYQGKLIENAILKRRLTKDILPGNEAPDFCLKDQTGREYTLQDFSGCYVFFDFWASWCSPCRAEMPNVILETSSFDSTIVKVVLVSLDNSRQRWLDAIKVDGTGRFVNLIENNGFKGKIATDYGVQFIPTSFLISPTGKILAKNLEINELKKNVEVFINK